MGEHTHDSECELYSEACGCDSRHALKQRCDELATALQIAMDIMVTEIDEFEFPSSFETIRAALAKMRGKGE